MLAMINCWKFVKPCNWDVREVVKAILDMYATCRAQRCSAMRAVGQAVITVISVISAIRPLSHHLYKWKIRLRSAQIKQFTIFTCFNLKIKSMYRIASLFFRKLAIRRRSAFGIDIFLFYYIFLIYWIVIIDVLFLCVILVYLLAAQIVVVHLDWHTTT